MYFIKLYNVHIIATVKQNTFKVHFEVHLHVDEGLILDIKHSRNELIEMILSVVCCLRQIANTFITGNILLQIVDFVVI